MNQVVDKINSCVIILNSESCISYINQNAITQLDLSDDALGKAAAIIATGDSIFDNEEFKIQVGKQSYTLVGNLFPVQLGLAEYAKIIIFREMKTFKSRIYELTKTGENIAIRRFVRFQLGESDER